MTLPMIVDQWLPKAFLEKMGYYAATCGHIEKMAWLLVMQTTGINVYDADDRAPMADVKANTGKLVKALKDAKVAPEFEEQMTAIARRIDKGRASRNVAIHGAWVFNQRTGKYRVEFVANYGTRKEPDWREDSDTLDEGQLDYAIADANSILNDLLRLLIDMKVLRSTARSKAASE